MRILLLALLILAPVANADTNKYGNPVEIIHHPVGFAGVKDACLYQGVQGCAVVNDDLTKCHIWYYRFDSVTRRHEERHCREGQWHIPGGAH